MAQAHKSTSGLERRRHPRLFQALPIKISSVEADILTETINLSCSGLFCTLSCHLEPMTKLKVHMLLPILKAGKVENHKVSCQGVVVRCELAKDKEHYHTAIFFNDIAPRDIHTISEYIAAHLHA